MKKLGQKLVDLLGNAISWKDQSELQTEDSRMGSVRSAYAEHPSRGLTPGRLAEILVEAERGSLKSQCELAEDLEEKDGHIYAELQKRKRALLGVTWSVVPPDNASEAEKKDAALIEDILTNLLDMDDIILDAADAIHKGYSNQELEWQRVENLFVPKTHYRDPSWFITHPENRNQLRLRTDEYEGTELRQFSWISHIHKAKSGYVGRMGLVRVLAWPFLFKNYSVRDLAEFCEIYGLPVRLGKYPAGASDKEKSSLLQAVLSIGHNAAGIIPKGMDIDFQSAAQGHSDPYEAMMAWCERTQSKAILGGTLTSQADGKSSTNALGNVHNEVRQELRDSDAKQIGHTLTRDLVYPLYALNGKSLSSPHRIPRLVFDLTEPEDIEHYAENLPKLVGIGMRIPSQWAHEKLQIPVPADDEEVLKVPAAEKPVTGLAALKSEGAKPDAVDTTVNKLQKVADAEASELLEQIQEMVLQADNLEQLRDRLHESYPNLSSGTLALLLGDSMAAASLAGRDDLIRDAV